MGSSDTHIPFSITTPESAARAARLAALREVSDMCLDRIQQILSEQGSQDRTTRYNEACIALDRIFELFKREEG